MKRNFYLLLTLSLLTGFATAETTISNISIDFSTILRPVDAHGFSVPQILAGGHVRSMGPGPVFVTLEVGGLHYTVPADQHGDYTFSAYSNNAGSFVVNAWTTDVAPTAQQTAPRKVSASHTFN